MRHVTNKKRWSLTEILHHPGFGSSLKRGCGVNFVSLPRTWSVMGWCRISSINRLMYFFCLTSHVNLTLCVLKLATRSACPAAMTGNILLCRDLVLRSWVPKHCQTESWRYDMSSELSLRLSPQRLSDRRASTWANMSRGLCHTSPTHRYLLLWQLMGHSGNYVWSLGGRVGVVLAMCSVFWQSSGDAQAGFVDTWCDPRER